MASCEQARTGRDDFFTSCEEEKDARTDEAGTREESNIPRRYRQGHDRINLERVQYDQRLARREFVRKAIRSLKCFFSR